MNFFRKWLQRPTPATGVSPKGAALPLPYRRFTLDDWRNSPERVSYVAELFRQPLFLDLLGMLANMRPYQPRDGKLDATTASVLYGQRLGHDQVIASLIAAGNSPVAPPTDIPADYNAANL